MHSDPPDDLDELAVGDAVARGWGIDVGELRYLPVGAGGYHWRATDGRGRELFVTVDDLDTKDWLGDDRPAVAAGLSSALSAACAVRDAGLGFVLAPLPSLDGDVLIPLGTRYAASLLPFIVGRSHPFGRQNHPTRRRVVLDMLIALHMTAPPRGAPDHTRPRVGVRSHLDGFLADPDALWTAGPLGEPARLLLRPHRDDLVNRLLAFDTASEELAVRMSTDAVVTAAVLTHGEPHAGNVLSVDGAELLLDWDTVGLAAPERDLWLVDMDDADLRHYAEATGHIPDIGAMALYRVRWQLDDLAHVVEALRRPHENGPVAERHLAAIEPLLADITATPVLPAG